MIPPESGLVSIVSGFHKIPYLLSGSILPATRRVVESGRTRRSDSQRRSAIPEELAEVSLRENENAPQWLALGFSLLRKV
jgi:hypothetical protein